MQRSLGGVVITSNRATPSRFRSSEPVRPGLARVLWRVTMWLWGVARFLVAIALDELRGTRTIRRDAAHARRIFESIGGMAVVAGKQLATRLDILPLEYANELSQMRDRAAPMDLEDALARVETAARGPLERTFSGFDPDPIFSDSAVCVYQAVLRSSGAKVSVKVRRPGATARLNAERLAIDWVLRGSAPLLPTRAGYITNIRRELSRLMLENLNFIRVARLQRLLAKELRKAKIEDVGTARVHIKLSSDEVIVTEHVDGVRLDEVIAARESGDPRLLAKLAEMNVDPEECGRRLLHISWWGFFENLFFWQPPDASQIVVERNGKLVFDSLGETGMFTFQQRKLLLHGFQHLATHEVEVAVSRLLQLLTPLPYIDVHELTKRIESRIWTRLCALEDRNSPPWERTSTAIWASLLRTTWEYGVSVRLDVCKMMQSACLYDRMAAELWPGINLFKEFRRYRKQAVQRSARAAVMRGARRDGLGAAAMRRERLRPMLRQLNLWADTVVDSLPVQSLSLAKKSAYSASQAVLAVADLSRIAVAAVALRILYLNYLSQPIDVEGVVRWVVWHPLFLAVLAFLFFTTARRIMFRLDDIDRAT